jgi:hypothetical protein
MWLAEMTIHGPRHDRILPQTGVIANKVPRRTIVFKVWYGKWRMANGKWQMADGKWRMANRLRPQDAA